ncbi:MAG: ABC transporter ATP-binding protein [Planctomycetota bacterium]
MIEVQELNKQFGSFSALKNVSFKAEKGEIVGFIGPNGAGKTTMIRILATLEDPSSGTAKISGYSVLNDPEKVRQSIGFMPDYYGTYDGIEVWEYLDFFAAAYKIPRSKRKKIVADVMELTDLTQVPNKLISTLSKGMKQRLCLAKTLIHDPQVLILDEPAAGLDPRARIELKMLLKELSTMGKTILISSHILTELADFIHSVVIIEHGEVKAFGSINTIREAFHEKISKESQLLLIQVHQQSEEAFEILKKNECVLQAEIKSNGIEFEFLGSDGEIYLVLKDLIDKQIPITSLKKIEKGLEDIFMQVTDGVVS